MNHLNVIPRPRLKWTYKIVVPMLMFSFLLSSCNVIQLVHLMRTGKVEQKNYFQEIPYEDEDKMILLEVSIDGVIYHFALDTGAPTMLSEDLAKKASVKEKCRVHSSDSQGNESTLGFSKVKEINFGQINYLNQGVAIYDFKQMRELSCFQFDGILGANTMKKSVWQYDLKNKVVRIANNIAPFKIPDNACRIKFKQQITGTPVFSVVIDGVLIPSVSLDYGSNLGIEIVSDQLCDSIIKKDLSLHRTFGYGSLGLYGGKHDTLYTYQHPEIIIEGQTFTDVSIRLAKTGESTIGTDFLKNYLVTVDWNEKIVYMEKIDNEPPATEIIPFGFNVMWQDAKLIIVQLQDGSPAYEAGLQLGDQVLSVNGVDYSQVQPDQYCDIFKNGLIGEEVDKIQLVFKNDSSIKEIIMQLKD